MATTSAEVIAWPVWNFTFGRSLNVQTVASLFGFQLTASSGMSCRAVRDAGQELAADAAGLEAALVLEGARLDRAGRRRDDGEAQPAGARRGTRRRGEGRGGLAGRSQQEPDHRHRHAEDARSPEQLAAVELAGEDVVDHRVLDRPRLVAAVLLKLPA